MRKSERKIFGSSGIDASTWDRTTREASQPPAIAILIWSKKGYKTRMVKLRADKVNRGKQLTSPS